MSQRTATQVEKKSAVPLVSGLLRHTAVRPLADHETPAVERPGPGFDHDFSHTAIRSTEPVVGQYYGTQACPVFPRTCPFGGACHTCPLPVQAKLKINQPGDKYEREAGRVADLVMRMPDPGLQRQVEPEEGEEEETIRPKPVAAQITPLLQRQIEPEEEEEEEEETIQTKQAGGRTPRHVPGLAAQVRSLKGGGRPLPRSVRNFFEPRFGCDFSQVQVHTDARAAESAQIVNARAYTVGRDIVFGPGRYVPSLHQGKSLLAHELVHVVQQRAQGLRKAPMPRASGNDRQAGDASRVTGELGKGKRVRVGSRLSTPLLQRAAVPTGIKLAEAKPFGHSDLKSDALKKKWRTYIGSTTLMQVTPSGNYKGHCVKEYLTEVANTCPSRFAQLRTSGFCTASQCLDIGRWGTAGDAPSGKMLTDGPDSFLDRHRTRHPKSLLEGSGKNKCSVVCHQRYKYDRRYDLGSFYVVRNFQAGQYTPPRSTTALHITTGGVQKVPAGLEAPSKEKFAKDIAPGLKKRGVLLDVPSVSKSSN